jgi:transposase InsO family protein
LAHQVVGSVGTAPGDLLAVADQPQVHAALVIEAFTRALGHRHVELGQLFVYTDQGGQYRANDYGDLLRERKIARSIAATGCRWEHAVVESFFSTFWPKASAKR